MQGFSPAPYPSTTPGSLKRLRYIVLRLPRGVYPEPDSSVAPLPQNDKKGRARNSKGGLALANQGKQKREGTEPLPHVFDQEQENLV